MLALEHKATLHQGGDRPAVTMKAQPFGGAVRILKPGRLRKSIAEFNYDSDRSKAEADFRIFINPTKWSALLEFCKRESVRGGEGSIDHYPGRELAEEFADTLGVMLSPEDYLIERIGLVIENDPSPTSNLRASRQPTARIYWIDEVKIKNSDLCHQMLNAGSSTKKLHELAIREYEEGGRGRANAIFTAPLDKIRAVYLELPPGKRNQPLELDGVILSGNVPAILELVDTPKFERIGIGN
jgi:hypothetical protein